MSEKEIIEIIEKELSYFRCTEDDIKFKDAIRGLIDLYDIEKEERERYKRIAEVNLKDSEEFRKNECEHRCIKNNEVLELKEELNKEKEKNRIMKAEFERLENIEDDTAQLKLLLKEEKEKNAKLLDEAIITYFDDEELKKSVANYLEKLLKKNIQKDYISKNKIREKIEIYRIAISDSKDGDFIHDARQKIQVLKELLEENNK